MNGRCTYICSFAFHLARREVERHVVAEEDGVRVDHEDVVLVVEQVFEEGEFGPSDGRVGGILTELVGVWNDDVITPSLRVALRASRSRQRTDECVGDGGKEKADG